MYDDEKEIEEDEEEVQESFFQKNKKMIIIVGVVLFIGILLMIVSGGSGGNNQEKPPEKKEMTLTLKYNGQDMVEGQEVVIKRMGSDNVNAYNEENTTVGITWKSSDEKIATVDPISGTVNGVSSGVVTITATYQKEGKDSITKSYQLKVVEGGNINSKLQGITSPGNALIMNIGMSHQLNVSYIPADGYVEKLEYSSTTPVTAVVSDTGVVTAYTLGKTTITVKANDNSSLMTQVDVYVVSDSMTTPLFGTFAKELKFETESLKLKIGDTKKLKYYKDNEMALDSYMKWKSSDESVATVDDNGLLTAIKEGSTQVTLSTITGVSAVMNVQVEKNIIDVESISGLSSTITIKVGEYYTITPTVKPDDASNKNLTFTSNNPSVVSVNPQSGISTMVYGISKGSASITVTSDNGKTVTVPVEVTSSSSSSSSSGSGSGNSCDYCWGSKGYTMQSTDGNLNCDKSCANKNPSTGQCPSVTFNINNADYLMVCDYSDGSSECTPSKKITSSDNTYKMSGSGMRILKVTQYGGSNSGTKKFWYNITSSDCGGSSSSSTTTTTTTEVKVSSMSISDNCSGTMGVGDTKTLTVSISPSNASNKNVLWSSSNTSVATVNQQGKVTAKGNGTATITVKASDDSGNYSTCTITVNGSSSSTTPTTTNYNSCSTNFVKQSEGFDDEYYFVWVENCDVNNFRKAHFITLATDSCPDIVKSPYAVNETDTGHIDADNGKYRYYTKLTDQYVFKYKKSIQGIKFEDDDAYLCIQWETSDGKLSPVKSIFLED